MPITPAPSCAGPGIGPGNGRARRSEGILAAVDRILAELADVRGGRGVLVVDDLHEVDDEPLVVATLTRFLQHLPGWLHVVLLSRRSPQLPLGRMRVRGQLDELGFDELRFSPDEARALMTELAPALSDGRVAAAARRADGWAASLQLAALAARAERARQSTGPGPDDGEAAGEAALLRDYVMGEVFGAEDEELVEALVDTAIVERVNGSLAGALTGRADAEELLQRAAARGLFVTRPGAEGWFVVHPPVRAVLAAELSRRAERLATRHARAAQWFEAAGDIPAAIDHLIQAGDARAALHLLAARHGELYDRGLEALVRRTIAAIPAEVAAGDLGARIDYAWCHLLVSRQRFSELVDQLTWSVARSAEPVEPPTGARVRILASIAALMNGDWNGGGALAREALDELGDAWWRDPLGRFGWNMVARDVALDERWDELSDELREIDVMLSRDPHRRLALEGTRALGEALAGRPVDALRVVAGVRRAVDAGHLPILRGELRLAEAVALRELGDRGAALQALEAIVATPSEALHHCRVLAALELTGARLDDGDLDAAGRDLDRALDLAAAGAGIGAVDRSGGGWWDVVSRVATRVALARGDAAEAAEWSGHIVDPLWRAVSEAQVQLATGEHAAAMATLEGADARCVRHEVVLALLRARAAPGAEESRPAAGGGGRARRGQRHAADRRLRGSRHRRARRARGLARTRRLGRPPAAGRHRRRPGRIGRRRPAPRRGRCAHRAGARRAALPAEPAHPAGDRLGAVRVPQHAQVPPQGDLPEAGRRLAGGGGRGGAPHGLGGPWGRYWARTFAFCQSNSSGVSTPRRRSSASASSWETGSATGTIHRPAPSPLQGGLASRSVPPVRLRSRPTTVTSSRRRPGPGR